MSGKAANIVREMATNTSLLFGDNAGAKPKKQVLIMDEVDGMSGTVLLVTVRQMRRGILASADAIIQWVEWTEC
jgi:hypothetical protein